MNVAGGSILRTLGPVLRQLADSLRGWIYQPHVRPLSILTQSTLEGLAQDFQRKATDIEAESTFVVILFMGGTGVGKSSLLNALAGSDIAQSSYTRPTTRECVVYHHQSLPPERLDPALRTCKLVAHSNDALLQKVLVDTPDIDSNEIANLLKLEAVLPVADIVLYVGSQEKYHDQLGWNLFRTQRKRRAFAFVLNKWDRCLASSETGVRPDADLLRDLEREGFHQPILFRTCAAHHAAGEPSQPPLEGEQFLQLQEWLQHGFNRLEIEALKARGIRQLLDHSRADLAQWTPPTLTTSLPATELVWQKVLRDETVGLTEAILATLDPNQLEIEYHFRVEGQRRFMRIMAAYLGIMNQMQHLGAQIGSKLSIVSKLPSAIAIKHQWNLTQFTHECMRVASERFLEQRFAAMHDRLIVATDEQQFPTGLLPDYFSQLARNDWRGQIEKRLADVFASVQKEWASQTGPLRWLQRGLVFAANILPEVTLLSGLILLMWRYYVRSYQPTLFDFAVPFLMTLIVLVFLHMLIHWLLPLKWSSIRSVFHGKLSKELLELLETNYRVVPGAIAQRIEAERKQLEAIAGQIDEVSQWLDGRQHAAHIDQLYGN